MFDFWVLRCPFVEDDLRVSTDDELVLSPWMPQKTFLELDHRISLQIGVFEEKGLKAGIQNHVLRAGVSSDSSHCQARIVERTSEIDRLKLQ